MGQNYPFFTNAVGRFISGSLTEKRTKDHNNRALPEDKQRYEFGIAFSKTDPDMARLFGEFNAYISQVWAADQQKLAALQNWFSTMQGVPMKISDGDAPSKQGKVNENAAGCFVFWFSSSYPVKCCDPANQEIDAASIKRGYYVQVAGNIADNGLAWQADGKGAGIYMNPNVIRLIGEGDEIVGGIDPATAFGGTAAPAQLPPGARPLGANVGLPGTQPTAPAAVPGMPGATPAPVQTAPVSAGMPGSPTPQPVAPQPTASPSSVVPGQPAAAAPAPHTQILNTPVPGQPVVPGMPGAQ
jgi:hypothetical protein